MSVGWKNIRSNQNNNNIYQNSNIQNHTDKFQRNLSAKYQSNNNCNNNPKIQHDTNKISDISSVSYHKNADVASNDVFEEKREVYQMYIDSDDEMETEDTDTLFEPMPALQNILMNHPAFNTKNNTYNKQFKELFIKQTLDTANLTIPVDTIPISVVQPFTATITAVADNGANIQCINYQTALQHKQYLLNERKGFNVRTGNGNVICRTYLPIQITHNNKIIHTKFYVLNKLPYNYLIGRSLIRLLGYSLQRANEEYVHKPETLDADFDMELMDCSNYPLPNQPKIEYDKISIDDTELKEYTIKLLKEYDDVIAKHEMDSGTIPNVEFPIEFKPNVDTTPVTSKEYPVKAEHKKEIIRQLGELEAAGFISRSKSPWRSPIFCVPKKTGDVRIVFDYRKLNSITKKMEFPLPNIEHIMPKFKDKEYITSLDIKGGYWHIPVKKEHRERTAFVFNNTLYEWNFMPFGPTNAPSFFQYTMMNLFKDLEFVIVYLDDISIVSNTKEEHKQHLKMVFDILKKHGIRLRIDKCIFGVQETQFLGFLINKIGIKPTEKYKDKVMNVPEPTTIKELQRFLGLVNYLHRFIPNIHKYEGPLTELLKKNVVFEMTPQRKEAFNKIKEKVQDTSYLVHPDFNKPFHVFSDASIEGIGGMLAQYDNNNKLQPISFCSKLFNKTQQNWHVSEQEIYAVVYLVEKWRHCLIHKQFIVHTDHKNLQELFNRAKNFRAGKLYRWAVRLQDFDFVAKYIAGKENVFADYLSRDGLFKESKSLDIIRADTADIVQSYTTHLISEILCCDNKQHMYLFDVFPYEYKYIPPKYDTDVDSGSESEEDEEYIENTNNYDSAPPIPILEPMSESDDDDDDDYQPPKNANISVPDKPNRFDRRKTRSLTKTEKEKILSNELVPTPSTPFIKGTQTQRKQYQRIIDEIKNINKEILSYKPNITKIDDVTISASITPIFDHYHSNALTEELIAAKQKEDPLIYPIINYLETQNINLLLTLPQYIKNYVLTGRYTFDDGLLLYEYNDKNLIVLPTALRRYIHAPRQK